MSSAQPASVAKTQQAAEFAHVAIAKIDAINTALRSQPMSRALFRDISVNQSHVVGKQIGDAFTQTSSV